MPQYTLSLELDPPAAITVLADAASMTGWSSRIMSSRGVKYRLPSNVLAGTFDDMAKAEKAYADLIPAVEIAIGRSIKCRKYLLSESAKVKFDSDDRKSSPKKTTDAVARTQKVGSIKKTAVK